MEGSQLETELNFFTPTDFLYPKVLTCALIFCLQGKLCCVNGTGGLELVLATAVTGGMP